MPFKIIETMHEKTNMPELCICPSSWEQHGILRWPNKKSKKLSKMEDSTPQPDWTKIRCVAKRKNILTHEMADQLLSEMLECSTTEQEYWAPVTATTEPRIEEFNVIAEQALHRNNDFTSATASQPVQNQDQETLYAIPVNQPAPLVEIEAIDTSQLDDIKSNQVEMYSKQQEILSNQKIIMENQNKIMIAIAEMSVKYDIINDKNNSSAVTKLAQNMKNSSANSRFHLKPIQNATELSHLEELLNDKDIQEDYKSKYSIVCQPGQAINCAYQLVDVFFSRDFLTKCSWSGSARGEGTKESLKLYKNVLNLFFELIYECDKSYTLAGNERFFKSILKNATKRKNSKLLRSSTCRNSQKRQKISEIAQNEIQNELRESHGSNEENDPVEVIVSNDNDIPAEDNDIPAEANIPNDNDIPE